MEAPGTDNERYLEKWSKVHREIARGIALTPQSHLASSILGLHALLQSGIELHQGEIMSTFTESRFDISKPVDALHTKNKVQDFKGEPIAPMNPAKLASVWQVAEQVIEIRWERLVKDNKEVARVVLHRLNDFFSRAEIITLCKSVRPYYSLEEPERSNGIISVTQKIAELLLEELRTMAAEDNLLREFNEQFYEDCRKPLERFFKQLSLPDF